MRTCSTIETTCRVVETLTYRMLRRSTAPPDPVTLPGSSAALPRINSGSAAGWRLWLCAFAGAAALLFILTRYPASHPPSFDRYAKSAGRYSSISEILRTVPQIGGAALLSPEFLTRRGVGARSNASKYYDILLQPLLPRPVKILHLGVADGDYLIVWRERENGERGLCALVTLGLHMRLEIPATPPFIDCSLRRRLAYLRCR